MRKVFFLFCITLSIGIIHSDPCRSQETVHPKLVLPENLFDAEKVKEDAAIEHTFKILNRGNGPLEIRKVKPG
jgi:hypothetical protein